VVWKPPEEIRMPPEEIRMPPEEIRMPPEEIRMLWDFADAAGSERRCAAASSDAARPAHHRAELATQIARAQGLQGHFSEADATLDAIGDLRGVVGARVLLERGRLRNSAGSPAEAVPVFRSAAKAANRVGATDLVVDALHMLAISDAGHEASVTARALEMVEESDDPEVLRWAAPLHNNLGWYLHDAGRLTEALAEFHRAHAASRLGEQEQVARWAIARCLRSMGRTGEALVMQRALVAERPHDKRVHQELEILEAVDDDPADAYGA